MLGNQTLWWAQKKSKKTKKENLPNNELCCTVEPSVKFKESEKKKRERDKYLNPARELERRWKMKVTVIPLVIGVLGTIHKSLIKGVEDLKITGQASWLKYY